MTLICDMGSSYWNREVETLARPALRSLQLERLKKIVGHALKTRHYSKRLSGAGIRSPEDLKGIEDLERIPFTTKDDLRESFPRGLLAVDDEEVVRLHTSSGTTGTPTVIYHTQDDLDRWTDLIARCIVGTGATRRDVFQNMMTYGLFTGGLGLHYGAERVGMTVIPMGGGNTRRQVQFMKDFRTTVVHATPSYMLHIHSQLGECHAAVADLALKKGYLGAEPYSENTRLKIEELYGIDVYNSYGLSEMNGPGVAFECIHKTGMHVWEDAYIMEIIHPETGELLGEGQEGEVVFTNLIRRATPLLRYRTRDRAMVIPGACPCGRTHRRLSRITGRTDDMLIINGVNVFPSQIEEVIMHVPEVGTNYQIHVDKDGALDRLTVKVELDARSFHDDIRELDHLRKRIRDDIKGSIVITPAVELHEPGSLPVFEGKARRVVDLRKKE